MREADIEVNATRLTLVMKRAGVPVDPDVLLSTPGGEAATLEVVVVHELGNLMGLDDSCKIGRRTSGRPIRGTCGAEQRERVMYAPARRLVPSKADVDELQVLYLRTDFTEQ